MFPPLENIYTLADLLSEAGRLIAEKQLRKFQFVFNDELVYELERTDARTNRIKYSQIQNNLAETMAYYESSKMADAIDDLFKDIRVQVNKFIFANQDAMKNAKFLLFANGEKAPIYIYQPQAGGYRYELKTE